MGLDIEALLTGAYRNEYPFRKEPFDENVVLRYVAAAHAMEEKQGADIRILSTWGKRLEAVGLWYDQLLAESIGKEERGAMPLTIVNTRDLHSRGQQHQEGQHDKYITNLIVKAKAVASRLPSAKATTTQDGLNELPKDTARLLSAAIAGTNQAYRSDNRATADLVLPKLDDDTLVNCCKC